MSRLDAELAVLFGRSTLEQAKRVSIEDLMPEAELVAEGARQLREAQGQPIKQREIVAGMDEDTALALCGWIRHAT